MAKTDTVSGGITSEEDMAEALKFICKSFYEKALNAELVERLGYDKRAVSGPNYARNGHSSKTVYSEAAS